MTRRFVQVAVAATGLVLALGSVTACTDDSTASAPITNAPVTTTSMYSAPPSGASTPAEGTPTPGVTTAPSASLPATGPNSTTTVPSNFPGPSGQPLSDKARNYLNALKAQNVTFMGDSDNSVALTMAEYVCGAKSKGTDPVTMKAFVTASVGPGTKTVEEANAKADKVIKAADENYC
ncbi:DUF732 domain-containing protein [Gordonia sp. ABSL1-1]|uniref:DUF732 domain-containing protein n=1 Tax=Gordonia sp. ABSL1-1 TaxID=3053923 RepID=UPI00257232C7|nr:DUF732 domain-containing protein [Gordonia sp. ABSL1-1]MDL9937647.1 DUF732 domain-containing protein [Gordonia sp. ABSL1-1]